MFSFFKRSPDPNEQGQRLAGMIAQVAIHETMEGTSGYFDFQLKRFVLPLHFE
jgi:hypothetical protein